MSLKVEYHDTEFEIAGHRFSMHQSHHIQDCCQKVIELRKRVRQGMVRFKSDLSDVYSDDVFSKFSPADLSDADLNSIVSGLNKGGHVNPDEVYTPYVDDGISNYPQERGCFVLEKGTVCCSCPFEVARPSV